MEQNMQTKLSAASTSFAKTKIPSLLSGHESTVQEIVERLRRSERVLIAAHEHPDGDAIGSSLALLHALSMQGKQVTTYIPDAAPEYLQFLPGFDRLTTTKPNVADYDLVVVLDCTKLFRAHLEAEVRAHPNTIVIDHHHDNDEGGTVNLVLTRAAAVAQILTEMFRMTEVDINHDMATCLLTGIFTDTGSFMHDSTTPEILELASELMGKGARLSHIAHETYQKKELPSLRIWGEVLSRVMVNEDTGAAVSLITHQDLAQHGATLEDLAGVVNLLNTLPKTNFALLLTEYEPGKIKGSLRSEPHKGVDVSKIAKRLGGGGHKLASGFEVDGRIIHADGQWRVLPQEQELA
ncbi:hypothetical protein CL628_01835 [bacterium]|nr:hypothetical protein [bacterium]